jgi:hypothetical protein
MERRHPDVSGTRLRLKDRTVTPEAVAALLAKDPARAANALRDGVRVEAEPAVLAWLNTTAVGPFIGDDGEVTASADMGSFVGGLIIGVVVGFVIGVAVGLSMNDDDDQTGSTQDPGETADTGDTGDGGGDQGGGSGDGGSGS